MSKKGLLIGLAVVVLAVAAYFAWSKPVSYTHLTLRTTPYV